MPASALDCSSSGKHQGLSVSAAAAADAGRTRRGHAIVAEGPPRPGLFPGLAGGTRALSSSERLRPLRPHRGFLPSRWRKRQGHRPKGDVAVRRGSSQQPRDSARGGAAAYRLCPEGTQADLLLCLKYTCLLLVSPEQVAYHRPREDGAVWRLPHLEPGAARGRAGGKESDRVRTAYLTQLPTHSEGGRALSATQEGANWFSAV